MYRVLNDGGKTFTDKINLSNTPAALAQFKKKGPNCLLLLLLALARVGGAITPFGQLRIYGAITYD